MTATDNLFPMTFSCNCVDGGESSYPTEDPGDTGDDGGDGGDGDTGGGGCNLYPIALSAATIAGVAQNTEIHDIFNGEQPGNFGWLSWVGDTNAPSLAASLSPPSDKDSLHYIDPDTGVQEPFTLGADGTRKVMGLTGVTNSSDTRAALDAILGDYILIPVWTSTTGTGSNAYYVIESFAVVRLLDYSLPHEWISAEFIAEVDSCEDYEPDQGTVSLGDPTTARYDIKLVSKSDDPVSGGKIWTYRVNKLWGDDMVKWGLELMPGCTNDSFVSLVDDDMGSAYFEDNYVVWDLPPGFMNGEFSLSLQNNFVSAPVNVMADDGDSDRYGTLAGPDCGYVANGSTLVSITPPDGDGGPGLGACLAPLDFESDDSGGSLGRGDIIDNEWSAWGVHVTSNDPASHPVMIFDSSNPTGGDSDLGTPNQDFGGPGVGAGGKSGRPGQNSQSLGNLLIISEDGDTNDPDDNGAGGTMIFTFDMPVRMDDVYVVDTDDYEAGGEVRAYSDLAGTELLASNKGLGLGDNSVQAIPINAIGVRRLEIELPGSGGVPAVVSCRNQGSNLYSIGNKVWSDANGNGLQDSDETGIQDVVMELRVDGMSQVVFETTTDSTGDYRFTNLPAGVYKVTIADENWSGGGALEAAVFTSRNAGDDTLDSDFDSSNKSIVTSVPKNGGDNLDVDAGFLVTEDEPECELPDCSDIEAPETAEIAFKDGNKKTEYEIQWMETVGNTWRYRVRYRKGRDLNFWSLGIDNCLEHVDGYSPGGAQKGLDSETGFNGLKWGVSEGFDEAEFSFTLDGEYRFRAVYALAHGGGSHGSTQIIGPDCSVPLNEPEPEPDPEPDPDGSPQVEEEEEDLVCDFRWLDWDGGTTSNLELQEYMNDTELSGKWRLGDVASGGPTVSDSALIATSLAQRAGDEVVIPLTEWNGEGYVVCGFAEVKLIDHNLGASPIRMSIQMLQGLRRSADTDPNANDYGARDIVILD